MLRRQLDLIEGLTIGGATVAVPSSGRGRWIVEGLARPFFRAEGSPVLDLTPRRLDPRRIGTDSVTFDSGLGWRVGRRDECWTITFWDDAPGGGSALHQAVVVDREWRSGILHLPPRRTGARPGAFFLGPPLEQILFISLLAHARALIVHATAVVVDGRAWVFAGSHGAGKSTTAGLLARRRGVALLNDDRVVLREVAGVWHAFGTPWAGSVLRVSPASAPIAAIFFLRHGAETRAVPMGRPQVVARLVQRSYHPYWDRDAVMQLLEAAQYIASDVPCFDFPFVPRSSAIMAAVARALK